ncbi:hypothetical protein [Streptomyces albipurpureus]|uniref:HTH cro/C1-type domain-containing protein n=1 Tax=Streptomyces albipurpureus TaxID=2897419 RepID=A0ABT0URS7_9ACTN|nr:hypothetical protein [Streptomyces sp. CWNU-1]MCM2391263.1 hypothetical protein [Streptomyces sp. CWNU-1]
MGRQEKPLDPGAGPVQRFAHDLRELRRAAGGPTYREMARTSVYSAPTLSAAASGVRLPTLAVALAYAAACGAEPAEWEKRWQEAADSDPGPAPDDGGNAPYPGLARYGPEDRHHFFGRDELIADLVALTRRAPFAALVGASGSGKSSLLRAGLIPALREIRGDQSPAGSPEPPSVIRILTPGPAPARTHRALFTEGALVLVDQFEEAFTLCHDPAERAAFIELLVNSAARVVIAVRADFYGRCAEHRSLAAALKESVLLVGPMAPEQLREAVVGPATAERLIVERGLTARIVADVADEPGGLPLMSHALLETWRRRRGRTLTETAYDAIGGVQGAIAHTAEEVFADFTEAEAATARLLLLRLISPGDGGQDTRRPADRTELLHLPGSERVLEQLVHSRLLTVDASAVNLAHEALITGWPRLRRWIEDDRDLLRLHRRLMDAARNWEELEREPGALYRGGQLESAREAFGLPAAISRLPQPSGGPARLLARVRRGAPAEAASSDVAQRNSASRLTPQERDFLTASLAAYDSELRASARTTHRLRALTVALSVLLCLAVIAGLALWEQNQAGERRATEAEARRTVQVASVLRESDPRAAMWLSLTAWQLADLPETRQALLEAAAQPEVDSFTPALPESDAPENSVWVRYSADGRTYLRVSPDRVDTWDVESRETKEELPGLGDHAARIVEIAPDLRTVAVRTSRGIRLWDLAAGGLVGPAFGPIGRDMEGYFAPGGRLFAVYARGGRLQLWDTRTGRRLLDTGDGQSIRRAAVSADDRLLAYCPDDKPLQVWDVREQRRLSVPWLGKAGACGDGEFAFTPNSRSIAVTSATGVRTWEVRSGRELPAIVLDGMPRLAFSADGAHAATLTGNTVRIWRTALTGSPIHDIPVSGSGLSDLRLDMASGVLRYTAGSEPSENIRTVAFDKPKTETETKARKWEATPFIGARFGPDGTRLVTLRPGVYELRDANGRLRTRFPGPRSAESPYDMPMAISSGEDFLARLNPRGRLVVHRIGFPKDDVTFPARPDISALAFTAHRTVAASRSSMAAKSIDIADAEKGSWHTLRRGADGRILTSSWDGLLFTDERQVVAAEDGTVRRAMNSEQWPVSMAVSADGLYTAMSDHLGRTTLWESGGHQLRAVLVPARESGSTSGQAPALAFSPDGRTLAIGGADGSIRLWDTSEPRSSGSPLPRANGPVLALSFDQNGSRLQVTTPHLASRLYPLDARHAAQTICERLSATPLWEVDWERHLPGVSYRPRCPS